MTSPRRSGPTVVRDPGIVIGFFTVRERTDAKWILDDERLPRDGSIAWLGDTKGDALEQATRWMEIHRATGRLPIVTVNPIPGRAPRRELVLVGNDGTDGGHE